MNPAVAVVGLCIHIGKLYVSRNWGAYIYDDGKTDDSKR